MTTQFSACIPRAIKTTQVRSRGGFAAFVILVGENEIEIIPQFEPGVDSVEVLAKGTGDNSHGHLAVQ